MFENNRGFYGNYWARIQESKNGIMGVKKGIMCLGLVQSWAPINIFISPHSCGLP